MGGVLDEPEAPVACVGGCLPGSDCAARVLHGDDRPGAWSTLTLSVAEVEAQRAVIDVHEHRCRAAGHHGLDGGAERERWHQDLVARPEVAAGQRQVERGGAAGGGDSMAVS